MQNRAFIVYAHNESAAREDYTAFSEWQAADDFAARIPAVNSEPPFATADRRVFVTVYVVPWPADDEGRLLPEAAVLALRDTSGDQERYGTLTQLLVLRPPAGTGDRWHEALFDGLNLGLEHLPYNFGGPESGILKLDGPTEDGCL
jgi:hypothetical protein